MKKKKQIKYKVMIKNLRSDDDAICLARIVQDGFIPCEKMRWFLQDDGHRHEFPTEGLAFQFSPERQKLIEEKNPQ